MPCAAYSIAAALAIPTTACLDATYAALVGMPTRPVIEEMLTIDPRCWRLGFGLASGYTEVHMLVLPLGVVLLGHLCELLTHAEEQPALVDSSHFVPLLLTPALPSYSRPWS